MSIESKILALKYRPQIFEDLIGQDIVSQTVYNSIKLNKIPNAYLFTGIRGVGKTTFARIIAKALNCQNGIEKLCIKNFCENCNSIINSNHIDVLEIDAASKTGVDDVRDLIEFSRYGPSSAKYKIFIIDEVHMLSKQAFNALLKTLEEPPEYLKFIFATTELKKIPVTIISRCQRFDLSRVKSQELFSYIKKIKDLEKGNVEDEAIKLIVKISEGSVRDALSLLDRLIIGKVDEKKIDLKEAQSIFGYIDKSSIIKLFEKIFEGNEDEVIQIYRSIYDSGVDPKVFLNDFLEILYYFKNISSLKVEGTNFSLNDDDFKKISKISESINSSTLILFWQFAIKALSELEIVSNQNISIEMFLIKLLHLKEIKTNDFEEKNLNHNKKDNPKEDSSLSSFDKKNDLPKKTINQIKNITQEDSLKQEEKSILEEKKTIKQFHDLVELCEKNKEVKLKYELENNVNLVSFADNKIEISFNENLDKNFLKDISLKLYEWTNKRWIISLTQKKGLLSIKETEKLKKERLFKDIKQSEDYKEIIETFPDAELVEVIGDNDKK